MIGTLGARSERSAHVGAVDVGKPEVEQHEVDVAEVIERGGACLRDRDCEALALESLGEGLPDRVFVLDEENASSLRHFVGHDSIVTRVCVVLGMLFDANRRRASTVTFLTFP